MPASAPHNVPVQGWTGSDCFRGSERPDEKEQLKKGLLCLWVTLGTSISFECSEETAGSFSFCGGSRLLAGWRNSAALCTHHLTCLRGFRVSCLTLRFVLLSIPKKKLNKNVDTLRYKQNS